MTRFHAFICSVALALLPLSASASSIRQEVLQGPVPVEVLRVIDGDTIAVKAHVWIGEDLEISVRLAGIDAPEIHGKCEKERTMAETAKEEVINLLTNSGASIYNVRLEKYAGRVLAGMKTADGVDISQHMLQKGLARPYHGEKRKPWCSAG